MDIRCNLIAGEWRTGQGHSINSNPAAPSEVVGYFAVADAQDVDEAAAAAVAAAPGWASSSPQLRSEILGRTAALLRSRADALGMLLAREEGKTLAEAKAEVVRAAQIFDFNAGEALRLTGDRIDSVRQGVEVDITREPLGVVGLITPWNFPIAIPAWKIAPALAFGNCVLFKPAELTPASAHMLVEILVEAGLPAGVLNLLMGPGSAIGSAIVNDHRVSGISFTGSTTVGHSIAQAAIQRLARIQLEMGGKNPVVVMDDADMDTAIDVCVNSAFYSTGQRCTAASRIIVHASIHDVFVERLATAMKALVVGNPLDTETQIGPVVSDRQRASNLAYVDLARNEGCEVVGGDAPDREGWFQRPALFLNANNDMRVAREEIFGPCAAVIKVADFDEAMAIANATEFGLSAGIVTRDLAHAHHFRRQSRAGMVMVNLPTAGVDFHVPFGGRGASSYGTREQGAYSRDFYTEMKTSYVKVK